MKHKIFFTILVCLVLIFIVSFLTLTYKKDSFGLAKKSGQVLGAKIHNSIKNVIAKEDFQAPEVVEIVRPVKRTEEEAPDIEADSALVVDKDSGIVLYEKNPDELRAIASITKLMTALVFIDNNPGWDEVYKIKEDDRVEGGAIYIYLGEEVRVRDLFHASLVGSANTATQALVNASGLSAEEFVDKMNKKAQEMGLSKTHFADFIGLDNNNISTAIEIAALLKEALANEDIREATLQPKYEFVTLGGNKKIIPSTDYLLKNLPPNGIRVIGGKTGYTEKAMFCFAGEFTNHKGDEIISVVLGGPTYESRFTESKKIVSWIYGNYSWQTTVVERLDLNENK